MDLKKPLYKSKQNKMLAGICGGIGEYFGIDPTLVRLGFVGFCILAGGGLIAYIIALIVIPEAPEGYTSSPEGGTGSAESADTAKESGTNAAESTDTTDESGANTADSAATSTES